MPYLFALQMQISLTLMLLCAAGCGGSTSPAEENTSSPGRYEDLLALFEEWRGFEEPRMIGGVPDYTAPAMAAQYQELSVYRRRLDRIDPGGWPVPRQVDYHLVRAEMNGLAFDHRIRRPWARNPAFYRLIHAGRSDVPAHEGPNVYPPIEIWTYAYPLDESDAGELAARIQTIPGLLDQARANLIEDARGLWMGGIRAMQTQIADLEALRARVTGLDELISTIDRARQATAEFQSWLEQELPSRNGPSGVGKENYTWYLQLVHLVPSTWEEEVTMMRRELARAHAALRLEVVASAEEYDRRFNASVDDYMAFLKEEEVISVRDYMDAALRARIGSFTPASGEPRGFFSQVNYRDPLVLMTHFHHWIELAVLDNSPHASPIRSKPLLYNIFDGRSEGLATGLEEMLMHAGLFDDRPRARELVWIMLAQRAARALAGLFLHSNDFSMEEAARFASDWTPRGWMPADSDTVWGEQHLYLQQPGYGTSYLVGKIEIENLIAERARQLGESFSLKRFMDEFRAAGLIPVSLIRWELTGQDDEIHRLE